MANIIQADKWMQDGKEVRRPYLAKGISFAQIVGSKDFMWIRVMEGGKRAKDGRCAIFDIGDLLAEDWEIMVTRRK